MALLLLADSMIESVASITLYPLSDDDTTETIYNLSTLAFAVVALILCLQLSFSFMNFQNPLYYSYLQVAFIITINASFSIKLIKRIHLGPGYCISAQFNVTQMIYDNIPANLPSSLLDLIDTIIDGLDLPPSCPPANTLWTFVEIQTVAFIVTINASFAIKLIKRIQLGAGLCVPSQFNIAEMISDNIPTSLPSSILEAIDTIINKVDLPPSCPPLNSLYAFVEIQSELISFQVVLFYMQPMLLDSLL
eukprot:gene10853-11830_t